MRARTWGNRRIPLPRRASSRPVRALGPTLAMLLAGCATPGLAPSDKPLSGQVTAAYFANDPAALVAAARGACSHPGEDFVTPAPGVAQCRMLLEPQATAAVILQFDGNIDDLPQLVVSLISARAGDGHAIAGCAFLKVPRKDGRVSRVVPAELAERCFSL